MQAGAREQPAELPAQHLASPGLEAELELEPRFMAPDYKGSGKLEGMVAHRHRRRLGHRPRGGGAVRARRRRRRASSTSNEHEDAARDPALRRGRGPALRD